MIKTEHKHKMEDWLPTSAKEVERRGWDSIDVILFTGDAYIDHPAFGAAVVGRMLEAHGLKVAIVPQPNWRDDLRDFKKLGQPNYFFGVTAGAMDSMVNHYTANRRLRSDDAYTPDGRAGQRPDYASVVYCNILKELYPDVPVLLGGIEASLRRVTHYDYWSDKLRPSILADSKADLLVYGMGEQPLLEIIRLIERGVPIESLKTIPQTAFVIPKEKSLPKNRNWKDLPLFSHEECLSDKTKYAKNFRHVEEESNRWQAARLTQDAGEHTIVINPPYPPMTTGELDASFDLPYTRLPHPRYIAKGPIPAFEMIKFSVNMHRGCFGGCSFCTISAHQGKFIASRSEESILKEVDAISQMPDFKGYLSDLGGPSANMYKMEGKNLKICQRCTRPSCIHPNICTNLDTNHSAMTRLYKAVNERPNIKKAFIGSGVRYDMLYNNMASNEEKESHRAYMQELIEHHVSGRLKVAPEHTSDQVLKIMRKPSFKLFHKFKADFDRINNSKKLNQQIIPYFISSHPGSEEMDMANLACETHDMDFKLEQVQDFTPTPMTVATVIYYSGIHPYTLEETYTPRSKNEKLQQRMYLFWYKKEYQEKIKDRLKSFKRFDMIKKLFPEKDNKSEKQSHKGRKSNFKKKKPSYKSKHRRTT
ncbi:YgiQ family radical SAM protein [Carboxylicivirga sediminis]|uniref:YgiQ family radical SAM protein n=1 Tax=Carboxylicivirga sediminis TaxID=2006564 RepID=A0A941F4L2_9BACT|nr:YgiQ family radical SAM protein [Carboxylicivirga sediminis]MBR8535838.1 YgiQ family radical SAM protein [Carboxylicivirga sediminis]